MGQVQIYPIHVGNDNAHGCIHNQKEIYEYSGGNYYKIADEATQALSLENGHYTMVEVLSNALAGGIVFTVNDGKATPWIKNDSDPIPRLTSWPPK